MWQDLLSALALVLVIEGIMPFLNPRRFQKTMQTISSLDVKTLRGMGLAAMMLGLLMLYLVR